MVLGQESPGKELLREEGGSEFSPGKQTQETLGMGEGKRPTFKELSILRESCSSEPLACFLGLGF